MRLFRSGGVAWCPGLISPPDDLENGHWPSLAFHHDVSQRSEYVSIRQSRPSSVADDDPGAVLLIERFKPRSEVDGVADNRIAHNGFRPDVARDHRPGVDADADVESGTSFRR